MKKISIGILSYNHEKFIQTCIESVLSLEYENLEIIISDDCSNDSTYKVIEATLYNTVSPHHIIVNRNQNNIGLASNFNKVFYELSSGDYLITLGGDDAIKENYLDECIKTFSNNKEVMMIDFNAELIDENFVHHGTASQLNFVKKMTDLKDFLSLEPIHSFAPGRIIRRDLISRFEPISEKCPTEDSVLVIRALLLGKHCRINRKVIFYRRHSGNISSKENLQNISNLRIITQYIQDAIKLYDTGFLNDTIMLKVLRRFRYEFNRREVVYRKKTKLRRRIEFYFLNRFNNI